VRAVVLLLCLLLNAPAYAQASTDAEGRQPAAEIEEIEEIEEVEEIEEIEPNGAAGSPSSEAPPVLELAGKLHPALIHFPIAWLLLALLFELLVFGAGLVSLEPAGRLTLTVAALSTLPAVITGLLRASAVASRPGAMELIGVHRLLAFSVLALSVGLAVLRLWRHGRISGAARILYLGLVSTAAALVLATGHQGGKISFGESFLPF
jgi:uncharacterized membrane protein